MTKLYQRIEFETAGHRILDAINEHDHGEDLIPTPRRFRAAWELWTSGYEQDPAKCLTVFESQAYSGLLFQGGITLWSTCRHHLAPFFGVCHIGYIPNGKIVGLSKFSRLVDVFVRRLQTQEYLTQQIGQAIHDSLSPIATGVVLRCRHSCMESRGVQKAGVTTYTSSLFGSFKTDISARAEFMQFVAVADRDVRL